jgi:hypothetical protein
MVPHLGARNLEITYRVGFEKPCIVERRRVRWRSRIWKLSHNKGGVMREKDDASCDDLTSQVELNENRTLTQTKHTL